MIRYVLFFVVILLSNTIQGITGFAGTILAMPFSLMLVGYGTAKPVLNVLGILSGVYVFVGNRKHVDWRELRRVVLVMLVGILAGIWIKGLFAGREGVLYKLLGVFIVGYSLYGLCQFFTGAKREGAEKPLGPVSSCAIMGAAGLVHGMFVCGGPLLTAYLTRKLPDKNVFRATVSTIWIVLNTIILIDDIRSGLWTAQLVGIQLISIPFFLVSMVLGTWLYKRMSQRLFTGLTYILLIISGVSLLIK